MEFIGKASVTPELQFTPMEIAVAANILSITLFDVTLSHIVNARSSMRPTADAQECQQPINLPDTFVYLCM